MGTMELIICIAIHAANIYNSKGDKEVLEKLHQKAWRSADAKDIYQRLPGRIERMVKQKLKLDIETVKK